MTAKPISMPPGTPGVSNGDIITIGGIFNRLPATTLAWWLMLIFGAPFACRHFGRAFPQRKISDPLSFFPLHRRELFEERKLQIFVVQLEAQSAVDA